MIACLTQGTLAADVTARTSSNGRPYWTGSIRTGVGEESIFINFVTFSETAGEKLGRLVKGSPVALAGELQSNVWTDREGVERKGWKLLVNDVLSLHQARKVRERAEAAE